MAGRECRGGCKQGGKAMSMGRSARDELPYPRFKTAPAYHTCYVHKMLAVHTWTSTYLINAGLFPLGSYYDFPPSC